MPRTKKRFNEEIAPPVASSSSEDEDEHLQPAVYPRSSFGGGKQLRPMGGKKIMRTEDSDDDSDDSDDSDDAMDTQPQQHNPYSGRGGKQLRPIGGKQIRYPSQNSDDENSDSEVESEEEPPPPMVIPARGGGGKSLSYMRPSAGKILQVPQRQQESSSESEEEEEEEAPRQIVWSGGGRGGKQLRQPEPVEHPKEEDDEEEEEEDDEEEEEEEEEDDDDGQDSEAMEIESDDSDAEIAKAPKPEIVKAPEANEVESEREDMEESSEEEYSSSEEEMSDDEKELDFGTLDQNQLIEGDGDRKYLDSLPEVQRESILAERFEELKAAEEMKKALRGNKRRERERKRLTSGKKAKPSKEKKAGKKPPTKPKKSSPAKDDGDGDDDQVENDAPDGTADDEKIARELGGYRKAKNRDETGVKAKKKAALDKMRKDRLDANKKEEKDGSDTDYGDDSNDDSESDGEFQPWAPSNKKKPTSNTAMADDSDEYSDAGYGNNQKALTEADLSDFALVTIPRRRLIRWCNEPFFQKAVKNFYVRLAIGRDQRTQKSCYRLCKVMGVETKKQYQFSAEPNSSQKPVTTNKWLRLKFAESTKLFKMMVISDTKPTEDDVKICLNQMKNRRGGDREVLSKKDAKKMKKTQDNLVNNYTYTVEDIQQSIEMKKNLSKKVSNIAAEKTKSDIAVKAAEAQLQEAKHHLVELESKLIEVDEMLEEKVQDDIDIAKERVQELDEELKRKKLMQKNILEAEASRLRRFGNSKMTSWAKVNQRAKAANKAADTEAYKSENAAKKEIIPEGDTKSLYARRKKSIKCLWEVGQEKQSDKISTNKDNGDVTMEERKQNEATESKIRSEEARERTKQKVKFANQMNDLAIEVETITAGMNGSNKKVSTRVRRGISIQEYMKRKSGTQ